MNKDSSRLFTVSVRISVGAVSQEYSYYPETDEYYKRDWCGSFSGGVHAEESDVPEDMLNYFNNFKGV